jgi:hypothetical protein
VPLLRARDRSHQGAARTVGDELRYVFRHLPLVDVHPYAELAARAAVAAQNQDQFWAMHDLLFANQDELEFEDIVGYASQLGLDIEVFLRDPRRRTNRCPRPRGRRKRRSQRRPRHSHLLRR